MPRILISYRRSDSAGITGRLFDRLVARYGKGSVFMDVQDVPYGVDFRRHVKDAMLRCDVVLAMIGPDWSGHGGNGACRIQEESDPVRIEIGTALKHNVPLIPVLIGRTIMPSASELPSDLKDLAYANAAPLDPGRDFDEHVRRLFERINELLGKDQTESAAANDGGTTALTDMTGFAAAKRRHLRSPAIVIGGCLLALVLAFGILLRLTNLVPSVPSGSTTGAQSPLIAKADLIVSPLSEDRVRPLDGYPVLASGGRVFTGGARLAMSLSHDRTGSAAIVIRRISPIINFVRGEDPQLAYSVSAGALGGSGITEPHQFIIRLNGAGRPGVVWVEQSGRQAAQPDNLLAVEPPKLIRLDRSDSIENLDITLVAMQPGTYTVAFGINYTVDGVDRMQQTGPIRIYQK